jgi:hypothetical protein
MQLEYKDILGFTIALLGVVVGVVAYMKADKADNTANSIAFRTLRHESLQKYADLVAKKRREFRSWFRELENEASSAYSDIINKIDDFGEKPKSGPFLRHIANDIVKLFFNAFSTELPWQSPRICTLESRTYFNSDIISKLKRLPVLR